MNTMNFLLTLILFLGVRVLPLFSAEVLDENKKNHNGSALHQVELGLTSPPKERFDINADYKQPDTKTFQDALFSGENINSLIDKIKREKNRIFEQTLLDDFFMHRIILHDFSCVQDKDICLTETRRLEALSCLLKAHGKDFIFRDVVNKRFKNKTVFECSIMQEPAWLKGTLFLLSNELVDVDQYELLGAKYNWDSGDNDCLFFQVDFKEDKKLADQVFVKMVNSWARSCKDLKIKNGEKFALSVSSLSKYFLNLRSYEGFPWFWDKKYYCSSLVEILQTSLSQDSIKTLDIFTLMDIRELAGDINLLVNNYTGAKENFKKCLSYCKMDPTFLVENFKIIIRVVDKMSLCYRKTGDMEKYRKIEKAYKEKSYTIKILNLILSDV